MCVCVFFSFSEDVRPVHEAILVFDITGLCVNYNSLQRFAVRHLPLPARFSQMMKIGKELFNMFQKGKMDVGGIMKIGKMAMS